MCAECDDLAKKIDELLLEHTPSEIVAMLSQRLRDSAASDSSDARITKREASNALEKAYDHIVGYGL